MNFYHAAGRIDGLTLNELFSDTGNTLASIGVVIAVGISKSQKGPIRSQESFCTLKVPFLSIES